MKTVSYSKTFQKGDDVLPEILDFVVSNIEVDDVTPEASSGELTPPDPQQNLKFKYVVSVRKFYL